MKRKAIIPLLLGLGVGLATVKLLVDTIRKAQASGANKQTISTVVAKQDIGTAQEITAEMVQLVETTDSLLTPVSERIESLDGVIGRVAAKAIPQQAPVLKSMLAPEGTRPGMQGQIPPGYRAVSVKIDEQSAAGYHLSPGDWVDVIVVMDVNTSVRGSKETIAEVILQHVQVAAIGHATESTPSSGGQDKVKPARSATLLVKDSDAPKLHLAGTRGKITLALRGDDTEITSSPASAQMGDIMPGHYSNRSDPPSPSPWFKLLEMVASSNTGSDSANSASQSSLLSSQDEVRPPHTVLVSRGIAKAGKPMAVELITFLDSESSEILNVQYGPPNRSQAVLGQSGRMQSSTNTVRSESSN